MRYVSSAHHTFKRTTSQASGQERTGYYDARLLFTYPIHNLFQIPNAVLPSEVNSLF